MKKIILTLILLATLFFNFSISSAQANTSPCYLESESPICDNHNPYDGYWWKDNWVPGLPSLETQMELLPASFMGIAVFYSPNRMEATAIYRGLKGYKSYVGGVSLPTCSAIGSSVWLKNEKQWSGPYLVSDCSQRNDLYGHIMFVGQAVEVDFDTAVRWGMAKLGGTENGGRWSTLKPMIDGVTVSFYPPYKRDMICPVSLKIWFPSTIIWDKPTNFHYLEEFPNFTWRVGNDKIQYIRHDEVCKRWTQ